MQPSAVRILSLLVLGLCVWGEPAGAFVANASERAPADPLEAAPTTSRWDANSASLAESDERGLGGGLEFSVDQSFCPALEFVDGTTCEDIHAFIVTAGNRWGEGNPNIYFVDVSDRIAAAAPENYAPDAALGAEINFYAVAREELPPGLQDASATTHTLISFIKPRSTNGSTLWGTEGTIVHATINFTTDNCWYLVEPVEPERCVSFGLILLHEIGHALGLGHPDELTNWNIDTDDDHSTPIEIVCLNPLSVLRHSANFNPNAIMVSTQTSEQEWQTALTADDLAGRNFLYPLCTEEELSQDPVFAGAPIPTLRVPVNGNFYPIDSLLRNEEGKVLLRLTIASDRSVATVELDTSSGYAELDEASIAIARNSRFTANDSAQNTAGEERILAEIAWELPLRPAFDIGQVSPNPTSLDTPAYLTQLPEDRSLLQVPDNSASAGEQGVVRVRAQISESGKVLGSEILEGSGYDGLDLAASALTMAATYDPAIRGGQNVESALEMAFSYAVLPGRPSTHCYPYPTDANLPTLRIARLGYGAPADSSKAERWVLVNETGEVETMIVATERGWMHVDDTLKRRWEASAAVPDAHPPQSCWYYRPFIVPRA